MEKLNSLKIKKALQRKLQELQSSYSSVLGDANSLDLDAVQKFINIALERQVLTTLIEELTDELSPLIEVEGNEIFLIVEHTNAYLQDLCKLAELPSKEASYIQQQISVDGRSFLLHIKHKAIDKEFYQSILWKNLKDSVRGCPKHERIYNWGEQK